MRACVCECMCVGVGVPWVSVRDMVVLASVEARGGSYGLYIKYYISYIKYMSH